LELQRNELAGPLDTEFVGLLTDCLENLDAFVIFSVTRVKGYELIWVSHFFLGVRGKRREITKECQIIEVQIVL